MSLRHVILTLVAECPSTGYDIARTFDERLAPFWSATHQQVYRDLKKMAEDGLVEGSKVAQRSRPDKIVYTMTAKGRDALLAWCAAPPVHRVNSDLLVKLQNAETLGVPAVMALLARARAAHAERLATYRAIDCSLEDQDRACWGAREVAMYAALRRGLCGETDWIGWIDETMAAFAALSPPSKAEPR